MKKYIYTNDSILSVDNTLSFDINGPSNNIVIRTHFTENAYVAAYVYIDDINGERLDNTVVLEMIANFIRNPFKRILYLENSHLIVGTQSDEEKQMNNQV